MGIKGKEFWQKNKKTLIIFTSIIFLTGALFGIHQFTNFWEKVFSWVGLSDFSEIAKEYPFSVHVLDVGKADAILVKQGDYAILIDGGTVDCGDEVSRYLSRQGIESLNLVINTHPDSDHLDGLREVSTQFLIQEFWMPELPEDVIPQTELYTEFMQILSEERVPVIHPKAGYSCQVGKMKIEVLAPVQMLESSNNNSIVCKLSYGKTSYLFMGDAEKEEEQDILDSYADLSADVLKIGHHGSATSTTEDFLKAVNPKYAVISVGEDRNKLPKESVLKRLRQYGIEIYRTDMVGTILFLSDGETITIKTER